MSTIVTLGGVPIVNSQDGQEPSMRVPVMTTSQRTSLTGLTNGVFVYDTDLNAFYGYVNGSWVAFAASAGSGPVTVDALATSAPANSTTTGVEITNLEQTLEVGTYVFQYFLIGQAAAISTGLKFGINFTGTLTSFRASLRQVGTGTTAVTGSGDDVNTAAQIIEGFTTRSLSTTIPNLGPTLGVATANQDVQLVIEGIIIVSSTGNLELWHGSEVAASTQVMAGSSLILTKVA